MLDPLDTLRSAIAAKVQPELLVDDNDTSQTTDDITIAKALRIPSISGVVEEPTIFPLNIETKFESKDPSTKKIDLKTVYNCWITRERNVADYINISDERGIFNLKFLERADLITWLEGASSESDYIKQEKKDNEQTEKSKIRADGEGPLGIPVKPTKHEISPELRKIYEQERNLVDHNRILRGSKKINFRSVSTECQQKIINAYRQTGKSSGGAITKSGPPTNHKGRPKEPIILLSPSASSLINMSNVKEFLENGVLVPTPISSNAPDIQRISRTLPTIGPMKFVVVNSVDKFKPEYWERVVAVFVTGQAWQFKTYQWSDPNVLFQKTLGFGVVYRGDPIPPNMKQWNITVEALDRNLRFRDREAVESIWDRLEKALIVKGWTGKRR